MESHSQLRRDNLLSINFLLDSFKRTSNSHVEFATIDNPEARSEEFPLINPRHPPEAFTSFSQGLVPY